MKRSKLIVYTVAALLAIIAPFAAVIITAFALPPQYSNSFVGELDDKIERLQSIEEDKIVIVGGSSVAFGIDSELIERYTGKPVVNFGLYAALGTKVMLDLSRSGIKEGDIVIIAPELDAQTLSLYFSNETTLNALDDDLSLLRYIPAEHWLGLLGGAWRFAKDKLYYLQNGAPNPEGIYNRESFNEYGDIKAGLRPDNIMWTYYDPNTVVDLSESIVDPEFIDYVNEYIDYCEDLGATVYYTWCPVNESGLKAGTSAESIAAFESFMKEKIDCPFIGSLSDSAAGPIMDKAYFYDSNFHLNDTGVKKRTVDLINLLLLELGDFTTIVDEEIPDPPELPELDIRYFGEDENSKYFTYVETNSGLKVTGLTELGKTQRELTLPVGHDGYIVSEIGANVFAGSSVETFNIPEDSVCRVIGNDAFKNSSVTKVYIYQLYDENNCNGPATLISPPNSFGGAKVYVPNTYHYGSNYDWQTRFTETELNELLKPIS